MSSQNTVAKNLLARIYREQQATRSGSEAVRHGLFLQLMAELGRFFGENPAAKSAGCMGDDIAAKQEIVEKAKAYLEEHYAKDVAVGDVAHHVCLSVSRFSHLFKEETGMSFLDYLLNNRLREFTINRRLLVW